MVRSLLDPGKGRARRSGARGAARLARTILLGAVAVGFAIYWLADTYGADPEALLDYLGASLVFVAVFALVGAAVGGGLMAPAAARRRRRAKDGNAGAASGKRSSAK